MKVFILGKGYAHINGDGRRWEYVYLGTDPWLKNHRFVDRSGIMRFGAGVEYSVLHRKPYDISKVKLMEILSKTTHHFVRQKLIELLETL